MNIIDTIKAISKLSHPIKVEVPLDLQDIHEIADALDAERGLECGAPDKGTGRVIFRLFDGNEYIGERYDDMVITDDGDEHRINDVQCWRPLDQFHRAHLDIIGSIRRATGDAGVPDSELHELVTGAYEQATRAETEAKAHHARYIALIERLHTTLDMTNLSPDALVHAVYQRGMDSANYATMMSTLAALLGLEQYDHDAIVREVAKRVAPVPEPFKVGDKVVIARRPADTDCGISAESWYRCLGQAGTVTVVQCGSCKVEFVDTNGTPDWWHLPTECLDPVTEWRTDSIDNAERGRRVEYLICNRSDEKCTGRVVENKDGDHMFSEDPDDGPAWRMAVVKWRYID